MALELRRMLIRFSLYGFLKNQRYFEPFMILAFMEKGLSFFAIGLLVGFREVMVNLWEIPSGAVADACGRRGSMIVSFVAYIASFLVFGFARHLAWLYLAMFCYAIGEAFRTGTHKAMIFQWLRLQGRSDERTRVYGFTRSWSQMGSAVSVLLAAGFVLWSDSYESVFFFAIVPYVLNIVNFLGYPKNLEGQRTPGRSPARVLALLRSTLTTTIRHRGVRRLALESMGWEGVFDAVKDYLQPILQSMALAGLGVAVVASGESEPRETALLVGAIYFVLYLLSAVASRQAHRVAVAWRGEERTARRLWMATAVLYLALTIGGVFDLHFVLVACFLVLYTLQNVWRPILVSRFDSLGDPDQGATLLSIESQAQRVMTMVAAPLLGLAVDLAGRHDLGGRFWPAGILGLASSLWFVLRRPPAT